MNIHIETDRIILRQFKVLDAKALYSICNQQYILKWMPGWKGSVETLKERIKWFKRQYSNASKNTVRLVLAVELKDKEELIGMVGIGNKEEVDNEIEIAYFISKDFSNNGNISEAVKAMSQWVFAKLGLECLI